MNISVLFVLPQSDQETSFVFAERQVSDLRDSGVKSSVFYLASRTRLLVLLKEIIRFRSFCRRERPDLVHAHYGSVLGLFAALFAPVPVVLTFRGSDLNPTPGVSLVRGSVTRLCSQVSALLANKIICVSSQLKSRLRGSRHKVVVIPTGVSTKQFFPRDRVEARKGVSLSPTRFIALFNLSSSSNPNKRLDLAQEAVRILRSEGLDLDLLVLNGTTAPFKMPLVVSSANVVLLCSDFEGSPTIVQEALACNIPVVAVDVGDVADMLRGVKGCSVVDRSPRSIASAIRGVMFGEVESDGVDFAYRYSLDAVNEKVIQVYRDALKKTLE